MTGQQSARSWLTAAMALIRQTLRDWSDDNASRLGAALAFYAVFSLAPLFMIAIAIAGMFYEPSQVRSEFDDQLTSLLGEQAAKAVQDLLSASQCATSRATFAGSLMLLWGATGLFSQLQQALNAIWEVRPKSGRSVIDIARTRLLPFMMVVGAGVVLLASTVLSASLQVAETWLVDRVTGVDRVLQAGHFLLSFLTICVMFAVVFKYVPDVKLRWSDVWIGAMVTAALFMAGRWGIGLYLAHGGVANSFGAAASLVVVLVWIYYSAQVVFLGAEFTQAYARMRGSLVEPSGEAESCVPAPRRDRRIDVM
jgi:membrane protein